MLKEETCLTHLLRAQRDLFFFHSELKGRCYRTVPIVPITSILFSFFSLSIWFAIEIYISIDRWSNRSVCVEYRVVSVTSGAAMSFVYRFVDRLSLSFRLLYFLYEYNKRIYKILYRLICHKLLIKNYIKCNTNQSNLNNIIISLYVQIKNYHIGF